MRVILLNTASIYTRIVAVACLSLLSSRWLLNGLGHVDWGLFAVIGGVIGFLSFVSGAMSTSVQRHLAYSIGSGNTEDVCKTFNAALLIHVCGAAATVLLGECIGIPVVNYVLNIPTDRLAAAHVVYQCVLFTTAMSVLSIPLLALFTAYQKLNILCIFEFLSAAFFFVLAYSIHFIDADRLIFYALCSTAINAAFLLVEIWLAIRTFPACRIHTPYMRNTKLLKEIACFSGWNLFGVVGSVCSRQGLTILLNVFFGPVVNAAYGVANQVNSQASQFTAGFLRSVSPEVMTREGRGERERTVNLAIRATKFATFLSLLWMVPLLTEIPTVLRIWLVNVPEYTATFCLLLFVAILCDNLSVGYVMIMQSVGKIAAYQVTVGTWIMMALPLAYFAVKLFHNPVVIPMVAGGVAAIQMLIRIGWVWRLMNVSPMRWIREVFLRALMAFILPISATFLIQQYIEPTGSRIVMTCGVSLGLSALSIYVVGLSPAEIDFLKDKFNKVLSYINMKRFTNNDRGLQ